MEEERAEHLWWSLEIGDEDADVEGATVKGYCNDIMVSCCARSRLNTAFFLFCCFEDAQNIFRHVLESMM